MFHHGFLRPPAPLPHSAVLRDRGAFGRGTLAYRQRAPPWTWLGTEVCGADLWVCVFSLQGVCEVKSRLVKESSLTFPFS